jgi:hypothetical protein
LGAQRIVGVVAVQRDHSAADRDRQIGHHADDRPCSQEAGAQRRGLDSGEDGHDHGVLGQKPAELRRDLVELLRLETEDGELRRIASLGHRRDSANALDWRAARPNGNRAG